MAFNIATFKTRALTASVFSAVMLAGLFWNVWSFIALLVIIHCGCWYEFARIAKNIKPRLNLLYGIAYITIPVVALLLLGLPNLLKIFHQRKAEDALYYSNLFPCVIIFSLWVNDTAAYLVGSLIGKTPFSKISPNKTWEGTIGGILLCVIVMGFIIAPLVYENTNPVTRNFISQYHWFVLAGICSVFGTLGDLLESKLKRLAGLKDSGNLMPGHGGFLDRLDSLLLASPFAWLYVHFIIY